MKIKHLLIGMLAIAGAVACKQEEPVVEPKLDVAPATVSVAATAGEATFDVTSNQSWVAITDADWVSLDPANGAASEKAVTVKVTADDNATAEARKATVTVKAGALTKTVEVTQAAAQGEEPGPGEDPGLQASEWALVGSFGDGNFWNAASELYLSVLDENYFVYYALELASDTEFKFLKGGAWPPTGQEIGGNGLVEPNTIQPAGGSNIKVTEAGTYDVYLAADLTKFYVMSVGKTPAEATEPKPVETSWGMMGMFVDNQWSSDVPMAKEGEWIVAKGAQFSELTFKIRGNQSWADATNIGVAPGSERGVVNGKVSVVTAEYSKANLGGDAADIKLNGEPGTYDVYFSVENMEVYVMEQGYKPGEKEPQNPDPVVITYTIAGTIEGQNWNPSSAEGLMVDEGEYHVARNVPFLMASTMYGGPEQFEFKIVETGTWTGYGRVEDVTNPVNTEVAVKLGGDNIMVAGPEGAYDVYFDKANGKVWVMTAGYKPGETPAQPEEPVDVDIDGKQWLFTWNTMYGASCVLDLGVTEPGVAILAYDLGALDPSYVGIMYPYIVATYSIAKTDGTSGVLTLELIEEGISLQIPYSNATETSVHFASEEFLYEDIDCELATSFVEITLDAAEGLADGEYWIIADGKVARTLTSNYGYLQVIDAEDGRSYAANAFTFTQVEDGLYTIQDANGKYYYQTGTYNSFNVSDKDGGTDEYLWEVYNTGNGEYAIINYATGKYVQLDSQYGTYGAYMDEKGSMPTLVLAENPIAEPEPEQPGEGVGEYETTLTCKTVSSAYTDGVATVNGTANVFTLKLGTSKLNGTATVTIPAGATEVSFYAVGWKNTNATLQFSVGGQVVGTQAIASNTGATGNAPYTMTVTDSDKYTLSLGGALAADTEVTVETTGSAYRAILFGIQAK